MKQVIFMIIGLLLFTSCKVLTPERMLRTPYSYAYSDISELEKVEEYRIAPNDKLSFQLYTNDGEKLIDPIEPSSQRQTRRGAEYLVEHDGKIKLPILGRIKISDYTIREAQKMLEEKYSAYYNRPFAQLEVTNNRVIIFPGGRGGSSQVLYLENTNTTLFEALAMAGGIDDGKAHNVKLIRGQTDNPKVYRIDLSTIKGVDSANFTLQANDIIYVEPRARVPERILETISPYATLTSTILLIYSLLN